MLYEDNDFLVHHGIKGQRWGIRRFQNEDGTLTEAGKKRYGSTSEEFDAKLTEARDKATKARAKYAKRRSKLLFTTDFAIHRAAKKWAKAEKEVSKMETIKANMAKGMGATFALYNVVRSVTDPTVKKLSDKINSNIEKLIYPEHMRGKSKEEKKAWAEKEKAKFEAETEKIKADSEFNKRLNKYDKLNDDDKQSVLDETKNRINSLMQKKRRSHDEEKELDGLKDWYDKADSELTFNKSHDSIKQKGLLKWLDDNHGNDKGDKIWSHIANSQEKLIDEWWNNRFNENGRNPNMSQDKYAEKLAKALDLPLTNENLYILKDWFINYDD